MQFNLSDTLALIRRRRSVSPNGFKPRKVQRDQLENMLEAANWAPTHGLTEPWRFSVFTGDAYLEMVEKVASIYEKHTVADKLNPIKGDKIRARKETCTVAIAVWLKRQESGRISEEEEVMAVACAVQNMALVATAYGMSLFWSSPPMIQHPEFADFLDIKSPDRCLGILYVGYPEGEWPEGRRNIWMNKVKWLGF
jgi:nitroreductase